MHLGSKGVTVIFRRKAYDRMLEWKRETNGTRALLVEGARRVGKSTLVKEFARREYAHHLMIDFSEASDELKSLFLQYRSDVSAFFLYLQAFTGVTLVRRESVVVFDEVQRFPPAREFIKQLVEDGRYDYIETGSLISIKKNVENIVIPSEERSLRLNPLDFEEFLWAIGEEQLASVARDSFESLTALPDALHRKCSRRFREYMLVGGLPQAVQAFVDEENFEAIDQVKRDILALYSNDISKFGGSDATRIRRVFSTLPSQLAKHDKKFTLAAMDKNARSRDYADAFFWLSDACISATCYNVDDPSVGLAASANESSFKCYQADTGLLVSQLFSDSGATPHEVYRDILLDKLELNEGMLTENAVAQQLLASGHSLYFYARRDSNDSSNTMEVDFLIARGYDDAAGRMRVSPIEVKSKKNYRFKSLDKFKRKFGSRVGTCFILHPGQVKREGDLIRLPLYMAVYL